MPIYIYKAKKGPSALIQGEIEANSESQAVSKINDMGLAPVSVVEKGIGAKTVIATPGEARGKQSQKEIASLVSLLAMTSARVKTQDIDKFTRQLSSLVKASVPILRTLTLLSQQTENRALKSVIGDLEKQVKEGKMLSEAMSEYPKLFNNLYLNMIKAGEKSGSLDAILQRLADYREKDREVKRKIQAAMAYPILMILVGIATVFVMFTYFLPKLTVLFEGMRQTLPLPTRILISLSNFMSSNWYWILMLLVFLAALFGRIKRGSKRKFLFDMAKLRVPIIKDFVKNAEIAKFCNTLGLLLKNGIPIYESLELATEALDNEVLKERLSQAREEIVAQGAALSESLTKIKIFPRFTVNMIAVGEEGGKLEESLAEVARVYERELEQAMKVITSLLEPLLILVVGAVVGFIVFAMLLPIFDIGVMPQ